MKSAFTYKGLAVGALLSLVCGAGGVYGMLLVRGSWWGLNASAPGAILLFFVLTFFVNTLLRLIHRPLALGRGDLVMIYTMMLMALTLPTQNFLVHIIPTMCIPFYSASPENDWRAVLHPLIPDWIAPQDYSAIKHLYEGLPAGQAIPWDAWVVPLGAWFALFLALSLMMICLSVILHRQWSTAEHLTYPMVHLPRLMIEEGSDPTARLGPFFKNPLVWLGFALPLVFFSFDGLNHYIPEVPTFSQFSPSLWWFENNVRVIIGFSFAWIGFFYLVSLDIIFSIWFFYLFSKLQEGAFSIVGIASTEKLSRYEAFQSADLVHQGLGAFVVFAIFGLWMARRHLLAVWRKAWNPTDPLDDSDEMLSYRTCLIGLAASLLFISGWLWLSGMPLVVLPLFLGIVLIYYIVITRVVTAGGIPTTRPPIVPPFFIISGLGASILGDRGLVAMGFAMGWAAEMRLFAMIACANSLELAEMIPGPKRRLLGHGFGFALRTRRLDLRADARRLHTRRHQPDRAFHRRRRSVEPPRPPAQLQARSGYARLALHRHRRSSRRLVDVGQSPLCLVAIAPARLCHCRWFYHRPDLVLGICCLALEGGSAALWRPRSVHPTAAVLSRYDPRRSNYRGPMARDRCFDGQLRQSHYGDVILGCDAVYDCF